VKVAVENNGSNCFVHVRLSLRNLVALLHKLDEPNSSRTILASTDSGVILRVTAETDEEHYRDHECGPMTSTTEAFIDAYSNQRK
jgi:hypothetical protein